VFLESVVHRFDFGSPVEEDALPLCHDLGLLLRMRSSDHDRAKLLVDILPHHDAAVVGVTHSKSGAPINEFREDLSVEDIRWGEVERAKRSIETDGQMELEAEVRSLVVVPKGGDILGYPMPRCTMQLAHFEDGGIHEADRTVNAQRVEQIPHLREHPMAVGHEAGVPGQTGKFRSKIQMTEGMEILQGFVMQDDRVPEKNGEEIAVGEQGRSSSSWISLGWEMICYPAAERNDMVGFQGEHSVIGRI
jgi:hypothetical protein